MMSNEDIAEYLDSIADLYLSSKSENVRRSAQYYTNAANAVRKQEKQLTDLTKEELQKIPSIGPSTAEAIYRFTRNLEEPDAIRKQRGEKLKKKPITKTPISNINKGLADYLDLLSDTTYNNSNTQGTARAYHSAALSIRENPNKISTVKEAGVRDFIEKDVRNYLEAQEYAKKLHTTNKTKSKNEIMDYLSDVMAGHDATDALDNARPYSSALYILKHTDKDVTNVVEAAEAGVTSALSDINKFVNEIRSPVSRYSNEVRSTLGSFPMYSTNVSNLTKQDIIKLLEDKVKDFRSKGNTDDAVRYSESIAKIKRYRGEVTNVTDASLKAGVKDTKVLGDIELLVKNSGSKDESGNKKYGDKTKKDVMKYLKYIADGIEQIEIEQGYDPRDYKIYLDAAMDLRDDKEITDEDVLEVIDDYVNNKTPQDEEIPIALEKGKKEAKRGLESRLNTLILGLEDLGEDTQEYEEALYKIKNYSGDVLNEDNLKKLGIKGDALTYISGSLFGNDDIDISKFGEAKSRGIAIITFKNTLSEEISDRLKELGYKDVSKLISDYSSSITTSNEAKEAGIFDRKALDVIDDYVRLYNARKVPELSKDAKEKLSKVSSFNEASKLDTSNKNKLLIFYANDLVVKPNKRDIEDIKKLIEKYDDTYIDKDGYTIVVKVRDDPEVVVKSLFPYDKGDLYYDRDDITILLQFNPSKKVRMVRIKNW